MKRISLIIISVLAVLLASCDKFLDVLPDNRAEIDSEQKIQSLLTSAILTTTTLWSRKCFVTTLTSSTTPMSAVSFLSSSGIGKTSRSRTTNRRKTSGDLSISQYLRLIMPFKPSSNWCRITVESGQPPFVRKGPRLLSAVPIAILSS